MVFYQLKEQMDWNRRELSVATLSNYISSNNNAREKLNSYFDYSSRVSTNIPFTIDEMHKLVCEYKKYDGEYKFARANEHTEKPYKLTKDGKIIRSYVLTILNNYEQLASNIFNGVLDENMSKDLLWKSVIQNYKFYEQYINHLRSQDHDNDPHALENFQWLAERWDKKPLSPVMRDTTG